MLTRLAAVKRERQTLTTVLGCVTIWQRPFSDAQQIVGQGKRATEAERDSNTSEGLILKAIVMSQMSGVRCPDQTWLMA